MTKLITPDFQAIDSKARNFIERMKRFDLQERLELLQNQFGKITFRSRFTLADQVLLHALVASKTDAKFTNLVVGENQTSEMKSLIEISKQAYGISFTELATDNADILIDSDIRIASKTSFAGKDARSGLIAVNPLADWTQNDLVQYVLDHEVPVNPLDMPGFIKRAA